jgi:hypothetical protein
MLPAVAQAQFTFTTNNGAITIITYYGSTNNVTIPGTINGHPVTSIANYTFVGFSFTNVTIPASVTNINTEAFYSCPGLKSFNVIGGNPSYTSAGGVLFNNPMTTLIKYPMALTGGYGIPSGVINIGNEAFQASSHLTGVTIPNSVTNIGDDAFNGCSGLMGVVIPDSITNIGYSAFDSCSGLKSATMGTNVTSIGDYAFANCSSLTNATLGSGVISIGNNAFESCSALTNVTIPNSVTNIGNWAFAYCSSLTSATLGTNVTSIGQSAFNWTSLAGVSIPSSVAIIGDSAFGGCSDLNNITIPNSVSSIGFEAFYECESLTWVTIGNGVTNIGQYAFGYCTSLDQVRFLGNAPSVGNGPGSADNTVFQGETGTAYYASDTAGWDATFGGWPTAAGSYQSKPQILGSGGGLGVLNNKFQFTFSWAANTIVVVEASTDLANPVWSPLATNTLTSGTSYFSDSQWTNYPGRFYRLRSP